MGLVDFHNLKGPDRKLSHKKFGIDISSGLVTTSYNLKHKTFGVDVSPGSVTALTFNPVIKASRMTLTLISLEQAIYALKLRYCLPQSDRNCLSWSPRKLGHITQVVCVRWENIL